MNLTKFLKEVDHCTGIMEAEKLVGFIHEVARTLPEKNRDDFLDKLKEAQGIWSENKASQREKKDEICAERETVKAATNCRSRMSS